MWTKSTLLENRNNSFTYKFFLCQLQFYYRYFEPQNHHNLLNEIFYVWKVVTALSVRSMRPFHYIMQCPHCILCFLVWLCVLFMGLYIYIFGFVLLLFRYIFRWFGFALFLFHNVLISFVAELFSFGNGFFEWILFIWLCAQLIWFSTLTILLCALLIMCSLYGLYLCAFCMCSFNVLFSCVLCICLFYALFFCGPLMRSFSCPLFVHSVYPSFLCSLFMCYFSVLFQWTFTGLVHGQKLLLQTGKHGRW